MALPADFSKIYGSAATGGLTPIGDVNYAKGWEFVGSNPPTKNDFSYLQNLSDLKSQWLYSNKLQRTDPFGDIKADGAAAIATALSNLGLDVALNGKQPKDDTLTAISGLTGAADKLPYFNGPDTAALTPLTAVGRSIIAGENKSDVVNYLGLGTASSKNVGTGTGQIPDMSAFSQTTSSSGYKNIAGFIIQWGAVTSASFPVIDTDVPVTYPIAFPTASLLSIATCYNPEKLNNADRMPQVIAFDRLGTTLRQSDIAAGQVQSWVTWLAIGY